MHFRSILFPKPISKEMYFKRKILMFFSGTVLFSHSVLSSFSHNNTESFGRNGALYKGERQD